jgi:aryl-alcohol dehydrogenase-like predicted oxidoreductase
MDINDRLYFGTWQLEKVLEQSSIKRVEEILLFAVDSGIKRFDTAAVYGKGMIEQVIGRCLPDTTYIVTKIPAMIKPSLHHPIPIGECYSQDHLKRSLEGSLNRLKKTTLDTVLLHNWLPSWSKEVEDVLQYLEVAKQWGLVKKVGISLPDDFCSYVDVTVLPFIDVIEAPCSRKQVWILNQLPALLGLQKEVIVRSIFCRGTLLASYSPEALLREALNHGSSFVIGMTNEEHIIHNLNVLKEYQNALV